MNGKAPARERPVKNLTFFREQRDKHLEQWMAINGRVSFGMIALLAAAWISMKDLPRIELGTRLFAAAILVVAGAILLVWALVSISNFHTDRIRRLEKKMADGSAEVDIEDCQIVPPDMGRKSVHPHRLVLLGLIMLGAATLLLIYEQYTASGKNEDPGTAITVSIKS